MVFNSYNFILYFLPLSLLLYWQINKNSCEKSKLILALMSVVFYCFSGVVGFLCILAIVMVNYLLAYVIHKGYGNRRLLLGIGLFFDIGCLIYSKYLGFIINNINLYLNMSYEIPVTVIPLGLSFIVFYLISYLVESYKNQDNPQKLLDVLLGTLFFAKVAQGPIVKHKEFVSQFELEDKQKFNYKNFASGITLFCIGLSKKVFFADVLASICQYGFDNSSKLSTIMAWITSLAYTAQIYFDFSGYSDMAIGVAQMFNIDLVPNFNSPYKAISIGDFWKRWHMSLTKFFTTYLYIPLGGSRNGFIRTLINTFIVFVISGIWHGAGWNFMMWGAIHGGLLVLEKIFLYFEFKPKHVIGRIISAFITFNFVNVAWVLFRTSNMADACNIIKAMFVLTEGNVKNAFKAVELYGIVEAFGLTPYIVMIVIVILLISYVIIFFGKNSAEITPWIVEKKNGAIVLAFLLCVSILCLGGGTEFLYNNF